jgi:hypothetical protein
MPQPPKTSSRQSREMTPAALVSKIRGLPGRLPLTDVYNSVSTKSELFEAQSFIIRKSPRQVFGTSDCAEARSTAFIERTFMSG